jgi:hypothetical protein
MYRSEFAPVELVDRQRLERRILREEAEVDVAELDAEVAELGREVQRVVVEGRRAPDAAVGVQEGRTEMLAHAEPAAMHHARLLRVVDDLPERVLVPVRVLEV